MNTQRQGCLVPREILVLLQSLTEGTPSCAALLELCRYHTVPLARDIQESQRRFEDLN